MTMTDLSTCCANCRYWEPLEYPVDIMSYVGWGMPLERTPSTHPWGECKRVDFYDPTTTDSRMFVRDLSGAGGDLRTREDFGCVMWEDRG